MCGMKLTKEACSISRGTLEKCVEILSNHLIAFDGEDELNDDYVIEAHDALKKELQGQNEANSYIDRVVMPFPRIDDGWPDEWFEKSAILKVSDVLILLDAMEDGGKMDENGMAVNSMLSHYDIGYETARLATYKKLLIIAKDNGCEA